MKKIAILISSLMLIIDLVTKQFIQTNFDSSKIVTVIPNFFEIRYVKNYGAAWGMLQDQRGLFLIITPLICAGLIYYFTKVHEPLNIFGIALVFVGALGNFYDRITLGFVRDMLSFNIFGYDFPVFNVADCCVVIGVGLLILATILEEMRLKNE